MVSTGSLRTLLVANRGEIALRVMRTARALGMRTVAVYSDGDRDAPHVGAADVAVRIGPTPAAQSYLDIDAILAAAKETGADAVHPGYGFLSERAELARALEDAGIALVGPSAAVMEQMGRKDAAREIAIAAGVPVVPSYGVDDDPAGFAYPVLVKAAAGGGGKGMRIVRSAAQLPEALAAAGREAASAFGDDTLLIEKYVERGRHIEVQVLGDAHGNVVHLFERDCSTQRRHQKVLEEAPAPTLSDDARRLVLDSAVALARHVGYQNAGTVEFIVESGDPAGAGESGGYPGGNPPGVYFLEMNTRLQVEHPVTESVVLHTTLQQRAAGMPGEPVDLVALQLLIARGEPLPFTQDDLTVQGHAIEARVYAEDPFAGFLPQAGRAVLVRWPQRTRVDHALESGQVVSTAYDPMLGKVIARGPDREAARRALVEALDDTAVVGLTTNTGFLRTLAAGDAFRDAGIDTAWLDREQVAPPDAEVAAVFAAWTQAALTAADVGHPFQPDGFRVGGTPAPQLVALREVHRGHERELVVDRAAGRVDGHEVIELGADGHVVRLVVDGHRHHAVVYPTAHQVEVVHQGQRHVFARPDVFADHGPAAGDGTLLAPMPGTVLDVRVAVGDSVVEGDVLGVMEAMKMELGLKAPFDGVVAAVDAAAGQQVALGARLFLVEPLPDEPAREQ